MFVLKDDDRRVVNILAPGQDLKEYPEPSLDLLIRYMNYLKKKIPKGIELTGIEDLGYFSWETKYYWDDPEQKTKKYKKLIKEYGSFLDIYKLVQIKGIIDEWNIGIVAEVARKKDKKRFGIPLHDLEGHGNSKEIDEIIEDYSMWIINSYYY